MKNLWVTLLLLLPVGFYGYAQDDLPAARDDYSNVQGNPYLLKDWSDGLVRFTSGREVRQFKLKFDCLRNRLLLQFGGTSFAAEGDVEAFVLYPKGKKKDSLLFRKGFPPVAPANGETFYQVVLQGKVTLLHLHIRNIIVQKQLIARDTYKRLEEADAYFLLKDGQMISLPDDPEQLPARFGDQAGAVRQFIKAHDLKMQSETDFAAVVGYYNNLLP